MVDGRLRRALKLGALVWFRAHVYAYRWQSRRLGLHVYELGGSCHGSGMCCEAPAIRVSFWTWYFPTARRLFLWWQRRVNQFELIETQAADRVFIFRCEHFDRSTRRCDSYQTRPGMCRDYPRVLLDQADPQFFRECGHYPLDPRRGEWAEMLDSPQLTDSQRNKLRQGLFLGPSGATTDGQEAHSGSGSRKTTPPDS